MADTPADTKEEDRPPLPPFTLEQAKKKVRMAENAWNGKNPKLVAMAYTPDSKWRNRHEIFQGRAAIQAFLTDKWQHESSYRLIKELWAHDANRIAVRFAYEWHDESDQWYRSYGNENWSFAADGRMQARHASINDLAIAASERKLVWEGGVRPDSFPELSELGL